MNVRSISLEYWVCFYFDVNYQIARLTTIAISFLWHSKINAIINPLWNFYRLLNLTMTCSFAFAWRTRVPVNLACAITVTTDLLNHKWTLPNCLEALASATTTGRCWCARFRPCAFACSTGVCSVKCNSFRHSLDSVHKVELNVDRNIRPLRLHLLSTPLLCVSAKHLLELFKNIAEASAAALLSASPSSELFMKAIEPLKSLTEWVLSSKWILLLFVACHACLVIHSPLALITKSFVCVVNSSELLLRFWSFVYIRMELFS